MAKERHNISTIAEVLIDRLDDVKALYSKLDKITEKSIKIDTTELEERLKEMKIYQEHILARYEKMANKKHALPHWVLGVIIALFSLLFIASIMAYNYADKADKYKAYIEHYKPIIEEYNNNQNQ